MLREYLTNIANTIRSKLGTTDKVNAQDFSDKVNEVYDKGREDYRIWLWNQLQRNGKATRYDGAFSITWTNEMFYPIFDMQPTNAQGMFQSFDLWRTPSDATMDLVERLAECGVTLDFSKNVSWVNVFGTSRINHVGVISIVGGTTIVASFASSRVEIIDKFVTKDDGSQAIGQLFNNANYLRHIGEMEGKIGKTTTFQSSPLDVHTMKLVISHLVNYAGTTSEGVNKLTFNVDCWESLESSTSPYEDGLTDDETMKWEDYVGGLGWLV